MKKEKINGITTYHLEKLISDEKMEKLFSKKIKPDLINLIIHDDADVYTTDGALLMKFRKNILPKNNIDDFYDNIIAFAKKPTSNRSMTIGNNKSKNKDSRKAMTNIIGYFDIFSPMQKYLFKKKNIKTPIEVRETFFISEYPEKYKKTIPLIQNIDYFYKKFIPSHYEKQRKKANQTPFKIPNTAFTTVTTNVNFQTTIHKDKGDDAEGMGNICVIERGKYSGAETCFPQYGVGVNVRTGDMLFMDVHQYHGNLPMIKEEPDAIRLSIVCYLRTNIWLRSKNKTKKFMIHHNKTVKKIKKQK